MSEKSITILLQELNAGNKELLNDIYSQLYNEIKAIATNQISKLNTGETITPTIMAHECYLKLVRQNNINISNKRHFLNYLAKSMRLLLIDILRAKSSLKRSHFTATQSYSLIVGEENIDFDLIEIDRLLNKIERINIEYCELLEYKLIFNLTFKEISEIIGKSERQVMRIWSQAITLVMALSEENREHESTGQ